MYLNPDRIIQNKGCYSFGGTKMFITFQRMPTSVAGWMWKASLTPLTTIFSTVFLFLGDELRPKCLGKERKLISVYLFPLSSHAFVCPAAATPHFQFKYTLHVLCANFEHIPWFDPWHVEYRGSQGATARLGVLNLESLLRLMGLRGSVFTTTQLKGGGISPRMSLKQHHWMRPQKGP